MTPEQKQTLKDCYFYDYAARISLQKPWIGKTFKAAKKMGIVAGGGAALTLVGQALPAVATGAVMVLNAASLGLLTAAGVTLGVGVAARNALVRRALQKDVESGELPRRFADEQLETAVAAIDKKRQQLVRQADGLLVEMGRLRETFAPFATKKDPADSQTAPAGETPAQNQAPKPGV